MGQVKGIGGLFFRARDPDALNAWYRERLGIGAGCNADDTGPVNEWVWNVTAGPVVFSATERAANKATVFIKYDGTNQTMVPGVFTSRWTYQAK